MRERETARSRFLFYLQEIEGYQKDQVAKGEGGQVLALEGRVPPRHLLVGDQAGHGGDEGAQAPDVGAHDQLFQIALTKLKKVREEGVELKLRMVDNIYCEACQKLKDVVEDAQRCC